MEQPSVRSSRAQTGSYRKGLHALMAMRIRQGASTTPVQYQVLHQLHSHIPDNHQQKASDNIVMLVQHYYLMLLSQEELPLNSLGYTEEAGAEKCPINENKD